MSAWAAASLIGAVSATVLLTLVVVVSRAVLRTAEKTRELVAALEQVQANTLVLADLEEQSAAAARLASRTASVLQQLRGPEIAGNGDAPHGTDAPSTEQITPEATVLWPSPEPLGADVPPPGEGPVAGTRRERGDAPCV